MDRINYVNHKGNIFSYDAAAKSANEIHPHNQFLTDI